MRESLEYIFSFEVCHVNFVRRNERARPENIFCVKCSDVYIFTSKRITENSEYMVIIEVLFMNFARCKDREEWRGRNILSVLRVLVHNYLRQNDR